MRIKIKCDSKNTERYISKLQDEILSNLDKALEVSSWAIVSRAKRLCPVDTGRLRSSITAVRVTPGFWKVGTNVEYAPYIEFGTGIFGPLHIRVQKRPPSEALERWARRHGLRGLGFVIARSIYNRGGLPPRPYLRPAFEAEKPLVLNRFITLMRSGGNV